jgi:tetraacyldisaccharide 4'-kinase
MDRPEAAPGDIPLTMDPAFFHALVSGRRRGLGATLLRVGLRLTSVPYGWAVGLRNRLFDRGWKQVHRAAVPVVSVGNLTLGGTGKTPCVEYVCRFYRDLDVRVAILSRGYGAEQGRNDEALVLEDNLPDVPHLQGPDRVSLAGVAIEELESELLVLDDGFQHRRLARDLDIALVDATNPWGHGYLFPRGLLRESPRSLRRAGVVVLTRCDQVSGEARGRLREQVSRFAPGVPVVESRHGPVELIDTEGQTERLERLRGATVAGFCGIGNPEAFQRTLEDLGADVGSFRTFPDHHGYSRADVEELRQWAGALPVGALVITTQKDLVKIRLPELSGRPLWALRILLQGLEEGGLTDLDENLRSVMPIVGADEES